MKFAPELNSMWAVVPTVGDTFRSDALAAIEKAMAAGKSPESYYAHEGNERALYAVDRGVAIIPLMGFMTNRESWMTRYLGAVATETFRAAVAAAAQDKDVAATLILADTGGGLVFGLPETAAVIRAAAKVKPIATCVEGMMCSAGVYVGIASGLGNVFISDEASVSGHIGVATAHIDMSEMMKKYGVKVTDIFAGENKRIDSPNAPLSEKGRKFLQGQVDTYYQQFLRSVSIDRQMEVAEVSARVAEARIFIGEQGIEAGLIDGVMTRNEVIERLRGAKPGKPLETKAARAAIQELPKMDKSNQEMTAAELSAQYPNLVASLTAAARNEGEAAGMKAGEAKGRTEGAKAESERLHDIDAAALPGYESIVEACKADPSKTASDVALQIIAAQKGEGKERMKQIEDQAPKPAKASPNAGEDEEITDDVKASRAKAYASENGVSFLQAYETLFEQGQ